MIRIQILLLLALTSLLMVHPQSSISGPISKTIAAKSSLSPSRIPAKPSEQGSTSGPANLEKCTGAAQAIAFSPDGKSIAVSCGDYSNKNAGRNIHLYDLAGGMRTLGLGDTGIYSISFSPDGRRIASGNADGVVRVWNLRTGAAQMLGAFSQRSGRSPDGTIWATSGEMHAAVAFAPRGFSLGLGGHDKTVRVWNGQTNRLRILGSCGSPVTSLAFSPDASRLAAACGSVRVWNVRTGALQVLGSDNDWFKTVAFSPDGKSVGSARSLKNEEPNNTPNIVLWDLRTGERHTLGNYGGNWGGWAAPISFSPDGLRLAAGGGDNLIRVFEVQTGRMRTSRIFDTNRERIDSIAFSPDGKSIAAGSGDGTIRITTTIW